MEKIINYILIPAICITIINSSCTHDEEVHLSENTSIEKRFLENLMEDYLEISELPLTQSRGQIDTFQTGTSSEFIYIEFPENKTDEFKVITSANELLYLSKEFGAFLSDTNDGLYTDSIPVDVNSLKQSMTPTIQSCKEYLNGLGMSNGEIELMLIENNVDETYLIPLAYNLISHSEFDPGMGFVIDVQTITGQEIADCALTVLGADIFRSLTTAGAFGWSKASIMRAFKTISRRMLGPVSCLIAGVEFGICIFEHW